MRDVCVCERERERNNLYHHYGARLVVNVQVGKAHTWQRERRLARCITMILVLIFFALVWLRNLQCYVLEPLGQILDRYKSAKPHLFHWSYAHL